MRFQIRDLGIGDILDQSFALIKDQARPLGLTALIGLAPMALFLAGLVALLGVEFVSAITTPQFGGEPALPDMSFLENLDETTIMLLVAGGGLLLLAGMVTMYLMYLASMGLVAGAYLDRPMPVNEAFGLARRKFFRILWTFLLIGLAVTLTMAAVAGVCTAAAMLVSEYLLIVLIPAGMVVMMRMFLRYTFAPFVVMLEGDTARASLGRSAMLIRGMYWKTFGLMLLVQLLFSIVGGAVQLIPLLGLPLSLLVQFTSIIYLVTVQLLLYFSARCRHEGFDVQFLAERTEPAPPSPPAWSAAG